ncbi:hypothetical protein JNB_19913 [Janibacter sp. HTCC2649]|uniref:DUF3626 domain-containing protein n=1 Tax=Janibacter sp. HTCC2649 TaxID=313589 RepID=UPI0000670F43|nr:DUF3626 domain-containing protein [Janibacter sp. HTCC2649]EAP97771.1 hypothetical protein JNB_19913 [Janibacter sp. HTCC2649]
MRPQEHALEHVRSLATGGSVDPSVRVTLNFHPDRIVGGPGGSPILELMTRDRLYRSQFETGTSNGGLTAYAGGSRWLWESRIFAGAYDEADAVHRPKYGALNFRHRTIGGSPRFGSAHFRLTAGTLSRTTFCYPDSYEEPEHFGVASRVSTLVALAEADDRGREEVLDDYVEAHVHGELLLDRDVEALVLDPCYRGTFVEESANRLGCAVEWHAGFRLSLDELRRHPGYRGPEFVSLGEEIARDGQLDPSVIGEASRTGRYDEQSLKRVWHYLARFGSDEMPPDNPAVRE